MSEAHQAVFLSYASQDAEAAKRICEALRTAGVEVWFDQSELRGGDAWDAMIRKRIKDCALFVPVISVNTQARAEGYFRLEWKLAVDRSHLMADDAAFLLPVVIGDVTDVAARVPDKFREVQWTRLRLDETPAQLAARVARLLSGADTEDRSQRTENRPAGRRHRPAWLRSAWAGVGILIVLVYAVRPMFRPTRVKEAPAAEVTAGTTELARVRARIIPDRWQRQDFEAVSSSLNRIIQTNPDEAEAWALLSIINTLQVTRNQDAGTKPLEAGKSAAERALRLARADPLGELALGMHLVAMVSRGGDVLAPRSHIDRALAGLPTDALTRYAELVSYWLGFQFEDTDRCARAWLAAEPSASFPAWILAQRHMTTRHPAEAVKWAEKAAADQDVTGVRALATMFDARFYLQADLPAARAALDRQKAGGQTVHRMVFARWLLAMAEHRWDAALQELAHLPESILFDRNFHGPKALLAGLAHRAAGRPEAMAAQLREAERLAREELARDPDNEELHAVLALTLACAGQAGGARAELAAIEPLLSDRAPSVYTGQLICLIAETHAELGEPDQLLPWLRKLFVEPSSLPFTPASVRLNPHFSRVLDAPGVQALLREFASLEQPPPVAAPQTVALSPAHELVEKARVLFQGLEATREDFALAEDYCQRALKLDSTDAEVWAAYAQLHSAFGYRGWDTSAERREQNRVMAERAIRLAPDSAQAKIAQAGAWTAFGINRAETEKLLREVLTTQPGNQPALRFLAVTMLNQDKLDECLALNERSAALPGGDPLALFNNSRYLWQRGRRAEAYAVLQRSLAQKPFSGSLTFKALMEIVWRGDPTAAEATLRQIPQSEMLEDRTNYTAGLVYYYQRRADAALAVWGAFPRDFYADFAYEGPKGLLLGRAHELDHRDAAARIEWRTALQLVEKRIAAAPNKPALYYYQASLLACLGEKAAAEEALHTYEQLAGLKPTPESPMTIELAFIYARLGRFDDIFAQSPSRYFRLIRIDPRFDGLRTDPRYLQLLAEFQRQNPEPPK